MNILSDPIGWWTSLGRPFKRVPRLGAVAILLALALSLAWTATTTTQLAQSEAARVAARPKDRVGDLELYRLINKRVEQGESFYVASLAEQRAHSYPTSPFVTVRLPTLAYIDAAVNNQTAKIVGGALLLIGIFLWVYRLGTADTMVIERIAAALFLLFGGIGMFRESALRFHEMPSGALLMIAMALYRPDRWWPALIAAALALSIRELALPFLLLWTAFALFQRSWREAGALVAVMLVFAVGLYFHAQAVAPHVLPTDLKSPGWDALNGPRLPLFALAKMSSLVVFPAWIGACIALLPIVGWLALGGRLGLFASLWFFGFFLMMALFARTNNNYWAIMMLPAYFAGLAFVPRALVELVQAAFSGQKSQS
jgi:hypothetical protein